MYETKPLIFLENFRGFVFLGVYSANTLSRPDLGQDALPRALPPARPSRPAAEEPPIAMNTTAPTDGLPASALLTLLDSLGEEQFLAQLLDWMHAALGADQCMLFFCAEDKRVSTLLYKDFAQDESARALAHSYISERRYMQDPNFALLKTCPPGELHVLHLDHLSTGMGPSYRRRFFDEPGFKDKLSIIRGHEAGNYYLNLYRRTGSFGEVLGQADDEQRIARLLGSLLVKHYLLNRKMLAQGPLAFLSQREQQVCQAVLQGKKSELIADELGISLHSVATYRKRAYEKLGISSRAQLFALCQ